MPIKGKLAVLLLMLMAAGLVVTSAGAAATSPDVDSLVRGFPTLDDLEAHLGLQPVGEDAENPQPKIRANQDGAQEAIHYVDARWFTAPLYANPLGGLAGSDTAATEKPLASLVADMDAAQKEAGEIGKDISRKNSLPINRYLFDRVTFYARTDYGTDITGLFVNGGIGFGTLQQTLRQNYGATYELPLLQRYSRSTKWTRALSGWTISSSVAAMPQLSQTLGFVQFLNNLQLSWSVSLSYNLTGSTIRKIADGQYDEDAALGNAAVRAAEERDRLLKKMALRIDALSTARPAHDSRLTSLRELYPQFELYQARYEQATSCDERMEDFFTLKGLALSLLTMAGYDRSGQGTDDLLQTWKRARLGGCGRT